MSELPTPESPSVEEILNGILDPKLPAITVAPRGGASVNLREYSLSGTETPLGPGSPLAPGGIYGPGGVSYPSAHWGQFLSFQGPYAGEPGYLDLPSDLKVGQSFSAEMIFDGATIALLGLTPGIYEWTIDGTQTEQVRVFVPDTASGSARVPGPVPVLAAGAAFGWSRRLRQRVRPTLPAPHS